jgi:hypothetical protein
MEAPLTETIMKKKKSEVLKRVRSLCYLPPTVLRKNQVPYGLLTLLFIIVFPGILFLLQS